MAITLQTPLYVGTLNVRGLSTRRKQYQLNRLFMENELDVIAIQETKIGSEEGTNRMVEPFRTYYNVYVSHAIGTAGGCALFVKHSTGISVDSVYTCDTGRLIVCDITLQAQNFRIVGLYAPNVANERRLFFESVEHYLTCDRTVIMMGDFNCVCRVEDRARVSAIRDASVSVLNSLTVEHQLEDVAYFLSNGTLPRFTHYQRDSQARLDRIYVSADLALFCNKYDVKNVSFSDHSLVICTLGPRKPAKFNWELWKCNVKIFDDEVYVQEIKRKIGDLLESEPGCYAEAWEDFKQNAKISAIERAGALRRQQRKEETELQSRLDFYLNAETAAPGTFAREIKEVKSKLEVINTERYRGAVLRARAEKIYMGENPTKRALSDEKSYASRNEIKAIMYRDEVVRDEKLIRRAFVDYYQELLGHEPQIEEGFPCEIGRAHV